MLPPSPPPNKAPYLNPAPTPTTVLIGATLSLPFTIVDETIATVKVAITAPTPTPSWMTQTVASNTLTFSMAPPLTDFTTVKIWNCKVTLTDAAGLKKDHSFDVTVKNTAPYFNPDPPLTMTMPWKTSTSISFPAFKDNEGHTDTGASKTVEYKATINAANTFI